MDCIIFIVEKRFKYIALYYDTLMKEIDYKAWVEYVLKIFKKKNKNPKIIIDLGCGTGNPTIILAKKGFKIYAVDSSKEMIEVLRKKIEKEKIRGIIPVVGDMRNFKIKEKVDAAVSFFDTINYILTKQDLLKCYKNVRGCLNEEGVFAFDINTVYGLEKVWGTNVFIREFGNIFSVWKSVWNHKKMVSTLYLTLFIKEKNGYRRVDEVHQEKAFTLSEHESILRKAGFKKIDFFHHLTFTPPLEISTRVMVVAEK